MCKLLFLFMTIPVIFCSQLCSLPDCFCEVDMVKGYNNGQEIFISQEVEAKTIVELFNKAIASSRQMPAFCVSLHEETIKAMQEGVWIEFCYDETLTCNEMTFDSILIHIETDTSGVNLIRGNGGKYNGRCYYLDLENNFNELYDYLISLETKSAEEKLEVELESSEIERVEIKTVSIEDEGVGDGNDDDEPLDLPSKAPAKKVI